jgi:gliding motility-associated-like protein
VATSPNHYTVTVSDGCTVTDINANAIFTITVNPLPVITFTVDRTEGCPPLDVNFTALSNNPGTDTYEWLADKNLIGTTNPLIHTFTQPDSIDIEFTVTSAAGCVSRIIKNDYIIVYPMPDASFYPTPQSASILEPTIYFTNTSQGAVSYDWNFGDPASGLTLNGSILTNPSHYYDHTGEYWVHLFATSNKGCRDEALVKVEITPDFALYIPNTFTPDGNSLNDIFQPAGVGIDEDNYKMEIFDRWGESIFSSDSFRKGWDGSVKGGKQAPQGVYIYKIMVYDTQGGKHPYVGHVTIIRKDTN